MIKKNAKNLTPEEYDAITVDILSEEFIEHVINLKRSMNKNKDIIKEWNSYSKKIGDIDKFIVVLDDLDAASAEDIEVFESLPNVIRVVLLEITMCKAIIEVQLEGYKDEFLEEGFSNEIMNEKIQDIQKTLDEYTDYVDYVFEEDFVDDFIDMLA